MAFFYNFKCYLAFVGRPSIIISIFKYSNTFPNRTPNIKIFEGEFDFFKKFSVIFKFSFIWIHIFAKLPQFSSIRTIEKLFSSFTPDKWQENLCSMPGLTIPRVITLLTCFEHWLVENMISRETLRKYIVLSPDFRISEQMVSLDYFGKTRHSLDIFVNFLPFTNAPISKKQPKSIFLLLNSTFKRQECL